MRSRHGLAKAMRIYATDPQRKQEPLTSSGRWILWQRMSMPRRSKRFLNGTPAARAAQGRRHPRLLQRKTLGFPLTKGFKKSRMFPTWGSPFGMRTARLRFMPYTAQTEKGSFAPVRISTIRNVILPCQSNTASAVQGISGIIMR